MGLTGCADPDDPLDEDDYFDERGSESSVSDPVEFSDVPYDERLDGLVGEVSIEELRDFPPPGDECPPDHLPDACNWTAFDAAYPVEDDCVPDMPWERVPKTTDELPAEIEGVVTLHPRYFENIDFCGSRQNYQGTFIIQDETTGVHVFEDSRIADVDVGDRVRLKVRGFDTSFDTDSVIAFETLEVLTERDDPVPVYYERLDRGFELDEDLYEVRRIRGEVVEEATNQNFGQMELESTEDPGVGWTASLDRELGNRDVGPDEGAIVELTGPVVDSFGLELIVATLGQMEIVESPSDE